MSIKFSSASDDYQPLGYLGRVPVNVALLLVMIYGGLMLANCLLWAVGLAGLEQWLALDTAAVLGRGQVWRLLTYPLVMTPPGIIFTAIGLLFFWWFGSDVERFMGRRAFIRLYLALAAVPVLFALGLSMFGPVYLAGPENIHFGVFVGFCCIYPGAIISPFIPVPVKWLALGYIVLYSLLLLAMQQWAGLLLFLVTPLTAYYFLRFQGVGEPLPVAEWVDRWRMNRKIRKSGLRVLPSPEASVREASVRASSGARRTRPRSADEARERTGASGGRAEAKRGVPAAERGWDIHAAVDPLLEKISRSGLQSLTEKERAELEKARAELLRNERNR